MSTPLCNAGLDFDEVSFTVDNRCVVPTQGDIAQSLDAPDRAMQADRMPYDESGQERFPSIVGEEACVDADSAIETASSALSPYRYKGPPHEDSETDLYVRAKCFAPSLAPFELRDPVS